MEEGAFFLCLHAYLDVSFPQHNHLNAKAVRSLYALHIVDHVRKARGEDGGRGAFTVCPLSKHSNEAAGNDSQQGFTRGRVLVLCPFRSVCFEVVKLTLALMPAKKQVAHMQRFEEEFGGEEDGSLVSKPQDYQHLREFDFLSSIEVCIVDRADVLRMQNWEHVQEVMQVVNRKPQGLGSIDISCLRSQFADGRAREFRQTVVTACGQSLDAEALFKLSSTQSGPAVPKERSLAARLRAPQLGRSKGRSMKLDAEEDDIEAGMSLEMLKSMEKTTSKALEMAAGPLEHVYGILVM
eukprot:g31774.t1